jgi:hypothetical protein
MEMKVNKDTVSRTVRCAENFSCLEGSKECLCPVHDCSNGNVHFIHPSLKAKGCSYRLDFGYTYICSCPVRKEMYNTYRI